MNVEPTRERTTKVFVPEGFVDFRCDECGDCCNEPPRITVPPGKRERLVRALTESNFRFPVHDAVMVEDGDPEERGMFALVGEKCVFLTDDGSCHLCNIGLPELRGLWCISFPVSPVITPRGVNYSISFACRKAVQMLRRPEPLQVLALTITGPPPPTSDQVFTVRHTIPTVAGQPELDWSAHRLIEGMLLAVARDWSLNLTDRLSVMPVMLEYLLRGYDGPGSDRTLRERISAVGHQLPEMVRMARSFSGDPAAHYNAIANIFGRRIGLRTRTRTRKIVDDALHQIRGRRTRVKTSELADVLDHLYTRHYKPGAAHIEHILGNYVICRIFANREMLTGGLYKGLYVIFYLTALVRFFAVAAAAARKTIADEETMLEAIRNAERLFGTGHGVFDFLDAWEEQHHMLDPAFAAALIRI